MKCPVSCRDAINRVSMHGELDPLCEIWCNKNVLIVSHDAGGAAILACLVKRRPEWNCRFVLEGPAQEIFSRHLGNFVSISREAAIEKIAEFGLVLVGTGWASTLERDFVKVALAGGTNCVAFIDHWIDYPARFKLGRKLILPNEIWVGDEFALKIAQKDFPSASIRLIPNPYFEEIREQLADLPAPKQEGKGKTVLFVCEPRIEVSMKKYGRPDYWKYDEFQAMRGYLKFLAAGKTPVDRVVLRLHPSETPGKYDEIISEFSSFFPISESETSELLVDIQLSDLIVGCDSMALVVGLIARKKVCSCIPAGGRPLSIPFPAIQKLFLP